MAPQDKPRVLVSDELSETAVQIFRDRGVEVDYMPKLGKDKEALAAVIDQYDGLAIRSAPRSPTSCSPTPSGSRSSAAPGSASTMSTFRPPRKKASS